MIGGLPGHKFAGTLQDNLEAECKKEYNVAMWLFKLLKSIVSGAEEETGVMQNPDANQTQIANAISVLMSLEYRVSRFGVDILKAQMRKVAALRKVVDLTRRYGVELGSRAAQAQILIWPSAMPTAAERHTLIAGDNQCSITHHTGLSKRL